MNRSLATILVLLVGTSGCSGAQERAVEDAAEVDGADAFLVPPLHVGDRLTYHIGFSAGAMTFNDQTDLTVVSASTVPDGGGHLRDAFLLRQGEPASAFWEEYWVDAHTYRQFKLVRPDNYSLVTKMDSPGPGVPAKKTFANGTGPLERFLEDPLFEDANFFGAFGSGRALPLGQEYNVTGNFWERGETSLLESGTWTATPEVGAAPHEAFGELRRLAFDAEWREGKDFETISWSGSFSRRAPLAVEAWRDLKAQFGTNTIDVRLNATLLKFEPSTGKELVRDDQSALAAVGKLARGPAEAFPGSAADARIGFRFQEAYDTLKLDPTASQYFTTHTGSYLRYAHMFEVDTCQFYPPQEYPGCHWYAWSGAFSAPDDYSMYFTVEKYHGGGASVAFTPIIPTEDLTDIVFEAVDGEIPTGPPPMAVVVAKSTQDLLPRNAYPMDAVTFAGAFDAFAQGATESNRNRMPNLLAVYLTEEGYMFYLANIQWVFPPEPELFPMYDDMPLELERHIVELHPSGRVVVNQNYDVVVTHK
ncbi:MAG TPA: hypothetical protein VI818_07890 [Candidatus Thermoplasmatota archaeon]|nr:hypothetical protein [Candidatus Thermoplasmatota archaeon]